MNQSLITKFAIVTALLSANGYAQTSRIDEGFTEPLHTIQIAAAEPGVIQSLLVREGDRVATGDVLCKLDAAVLEATLASAQIKQGSQGKLQAAEATLKNKENTLKQMQILLTRQHASAKEVLQAELDFELAQANLQSAQDELKLQAAEIKQIMAQIERRVVRAPADGIILELPRQAGEAITGADIQVAVLVCLQQLRVRYFLDTTAAAELKPKSALNVSFPETGQRTQAIVDFIAPVTDSNSGTVRVELLIDNPSNEFRSGLRCVLQRDHTLVSDAGR